VKAALHQMRIAPEVISDTPSISVRTHAPSVGLAMTKCSIEVSGMSTLLVRPRLPAACSSPLPARFSPHSPHVSTR
jgi:hypothetical protein